MRALLFAALLMTQPVLAEELSPQGMLEWAGDVATYTFGDWRVTAGATGPEDARIATLKVERPGFEALEREFESAGTGFGTIGFFPLASGAEPSLVFGAYSGGAHCCMQSITVTPVGDELVVGELGTYDGDGVPIEDVDTDGGFEVLIPDGRFNYTFDAYAFSSAPTQINRFKDGVPYDASLEAPFKPFLEAELARDAEGCKGEGDWYQGQCAAMAANAARLGRYAEYFNPMAKALGEGKTMASGWTDFEFCEADECKFTSFVEALPYALKLWGYLKD